MADEKTSGYPRARADEKNRRTAEISGFAWRFEAPFDAQEPGVS